MGRALAAPLLAALAGCAGAMSGAPEPVTDPVLLAPGGATLEAANGASWRLVTDRVMGGVSDGDLRPGRHQGRECLRLTGAVSTANNGGFVQMALDLGGDAPLDAGAYRGIELEVAGNGEAYNVHLRTRGLWLPWQSYRAGFTAEAQWRTLRLPLTAFEAYRTDRAFDPGALVRLGIVAIGRDFQADLCVAGVRFYGASEEAPRP